HGCRLARVSLRCTDSNRRHHGLYKSRQWHVIGRRSDLWVLGGARVFPGVSESEKHLAFIWDVRDAGGCDGSQVSELMENNAGRADDGSE
ncbi:Tryptophan dimethylallyltransferase nptA, partial [Clarias magur]